MHADHVVVLVEDDGPMRQAVQRVLCGSGYTVDAFESAEDLLAAIEGGAPWNTNRCCICDVRLPGMSGFELHRRLAEHGGLPPWIFITAHDDPSVRDQARRLGAGFLLKPFEGRALLALMKQELAEPKLH